MQVINFSVKVMHNLTAGAMACTILSHNFIQESWLTHMRATKFTQIYAKYASHQIYANLPLAFKVIFSVHFYLNLQFLQ